MTNGCDSNANCTNTAGSYTCACQSGYTGNGTTCSDIDECALDPCHDNATCSDNINAYGCTCNAGYTGNSTYCTDVPECETPGRCGSDPNYGSGPDETDEFGNCTETSGSYTCDCYPGFEDATGPTCTDINECANDTLSNCTAGEDCINANGTFSCATTTTTTTTATTTTTTPTIVAPPPPPPDDDDKKKLVDWQIALIAIGGVLAVLLAVLAYVYRPNQKKGYKLLKEA
jgi:hypothetical protein